MLTTDDREFLRGEKDFEHQTTESKTRGRIRKRVYNGLLDFVLIFEELDKRDVERLVEADDGEAFDAVVAALAFFHDVADRTGWDITELVERAAEQCYTHERSGRRIVKDADYSLELGEQNLAETARRVERKHDRGMVGSLTDREIRVATLLDMREVLDDWKAAVYEQEFDDRKEEAIEKMERKRELLGKENPDVAALFDTDGDDE